MVSKTADQIIGNLFFASSSYLNTDKSQYPKINIVYAPSLFHSFRILRAEMVEALNSE